MGVVGFGLSKTITIGNWTDLIISAGPRAAVSAHTWAATIQSITDTMSAGNTKIEVEDSTNTDEKSSGLRCAHCMFYS